MALNVTRPAIAQHIVVRDAHTSLAAALHGVKKLVATPLVAVGAAVKPLDVDLAPAHAPPLPADHAATLLRALFAAASRLEAALRTLRGGDPVRGGSIANGAAGAAAGGPPVVRGASASGAGKAVPVL
jgi:hypothetical protein